VEDAYQRVWRRLRAKFTDPEQQRTHFRDAFMGELNPLIAAQHNGTRTPRKNKPDVAHLTADERRGLERQMGRVADALEGLQAGIDLLISLYLGGKGPAEGEDQDSPVDGP